MTMHVKKVRFKNNELRQNEDSDLLQDKIYSTSFVHVGGQANPFADFGVTFGCGCQDVSARVQQPPVVSIFS